MEVILKFEPLSGEIFKMTCLLECRSILDSARRLINSCSFCPSAHQPFFPDDVTYTFSYLFISQQMINTWCDACNLWRHPIAAYLANNASEIFVLRSTFVVTDKCYLQMVICDKKSRLWSYAAHFARRLIKSCSFCSSISRGFPKRPIQLAINLFCSKSVLCQSIPGVKQVVCVVVQSPFASQTILVWFSLPGRAPLSQTRNASLG